MKLKHTTIGMALTLAATVSLSACGGSGTPATGNDAMMSSGAGNDAMMSSQSGAMSSDDAMANGDQMGTDNAMATDDQMTATDQMSSDDAMAKGGNDAMASDPPKQ